MKLHTATETMSFVKEIEEKSAKFYEALSLKYTKDAEIFLSFSKENRQNFKQIQRSYYSVITDAIEGGYAFDLDTNEYNFEIEVPEDASYSDALIRAQEIEEKVLRFYSVAADQSMSLMADIPRSFRRVVQKREARIVQLKSLAR